MYRGYLASFTKKYPFIPTLVSFIVGIIAAYWLPGYRSISFYSGISMLVTRLLLSWMPKKKPMLLFCIQYSTVLLISCISGYYWLEKRNPLLNAQHIDHFLSAMQAYEGILLKQDITNNKGWSALVIVQRIHVDGQWQQATGKVEVSGWGSLSGVPYGAYIQIHGAPSRIAAPLNPNVTNWQLFKQAKGIWHRDFLQKGSYHFIARKKGYLLQGWLYKWRQKATKSLLHHIEDPDIGSIVGAMLLGTKVGLGQEVETLYSETGVMHILAVSGMHVGLIYYLLLLLLYWLGFLLELFKKYAERIAIFLLGLYVVFIGSTPPAVRAWGMLVLWRLGKWLGKDIIPTNLLAFVAFVLLLYNPYSLFSVSFQLSFAAAASIIYLYLPLVNHYTLKRVVGYYLGQSILLSLSILLGTWPLLVHHFHMIPFYSFLGNALMVPFASFILILGFTLLLGASCCPLLTHFSSQALTWLFQLLHFGLTLIHALPYAHGQAIFWPLKSMILLYIGLLASSQALIYQKRIYYYLALICLLSGGTKWLHNQYQIRHCPPTIIIYSVAPHTVIGFFEKRKVILLVEGSIEQHDRLFLQAIAPSLAARQVVHTEWLRWQDCLGQQQLGAKEKKGIRYLTWQGKVIAWIPKPIKQPDNLGKIATATIHVIPSEQVKCFAPILSSEKSSQIVVVGKQQKDTVGSNSSPLACFSRSFDHTWPNSQSSYKGKGMT